MTLQMCRVCLQQGYDYVSLDDGKESYRHKLTTCVPEINVDILTSPMLCHECSIRLNEAYKFKCTCLDSEKRINENVTLGINLEDSSESIADFQIDDIAITERYVKERKRRHSDAVLNNADVTIKQERDSDYDSEDVGNKRRRSNDDLTCEIRNVKAEPMDQVCVDDDDEENREGSSTTVSVDVSSPGAIKEEQQDFFYSEYEVDSKANNNVSSNDQQINKNKVSEILTEHSYHMNFVEIEELEAETVDSDLSEPVLADEDKLNKIYCAVCNELYHKQYIPAHMELHKTMKSLKSSETQEDGYLKVNMNTEKKFMCRHCNKIFSEGVDLYDHINLTHSTGFLTESNASKGVLCKICNQSFDKRIIRRHVESHDAEKIEANVDSASQIKLMCKVCGDVFAEEEPFTAHYRSHKQSEELTTCKVCGETYDQNSVKVHLEFHNIVEEIILDDDIDETTFSSLNTDLNSDQAASTSGSKTSAYACCDEVFNNLYLLHLHTTRVHGYVCYVCNINFPNKQALGGHFRVHNEQKSHQCTNCGKYFKQRGNLLRHTHFVHNCIMPYKCDKCGERFRRNKYLEEHLRGHMQKYVCDDCDSVFLDMKLLRKHRRFHMPRPYQCDMCDTVFTAKSSLVRHKRDIHKMKILGKRSYGLGDVVLGSTETNE